MTDVADASVTVKYHLTIDTLNHGSGPLSSASYLAKIVDSIGVLFSVTLLIILDLL